MPFVFLQVGIAQRTDFVPLNFQDLLCVVTVEKEKLKKGIKYIVTYLSLVSRIS